MLSGYRGILVGFEVAPTKGTKGYEEFMVKNYIAYAELLIRSESDIFRVLFTQAEPN
jgi:hypothetical protein